MQRNQLTEGRVLDGKFRIEQVLGVGGMGIVAAATHLQLNKRVALKFLSCESKHSPETIARFLREGRALAQLESLHVARIMDVGELCPDEPYLVMEYLEGTDLSRLLKVNGPVRPSDALTYVLQACQGIADAHALGIIHRDLKPSNLFLTTSSRDAPLVKVLDFGISKILTPPVLGSETSHATTTGALIGSPNYMSPEQIRDARLVDQRTDIWSLGVVLHELLTGTLPFRGTTLSGTLAAIAADPPVPLRRVCADAPEELELIILRCLEKRVDSRYRNVEELACQLLRLLPDGAIAARPRYLSAQAPRTVHSLSVPSVTQLPPSQSTQLVTAHDFNTAPTRVTGGPRWRALAAFGVLLVAGGVAALRAVRSSAIGPQTPALLVTETRPLATPAPALTVETPTIPSPPEVTVPSASASVVSEKHPEGTPRKPLSLLAKRKSPAPFPTRLPLNTEASERVTSTGNGQALPIEEEGTRDRK